MNENISRETNTAHASYVNIAPVERIVSGAVGGLLLFNGIAKKGKSGSAQAIAGAVLLFRAVSGYSVVYDAIGKERIPRVARNINIRTQLTVNKPRNEVYAFWRELENLPLFMSHIKNVDTIDDKYSVWKAKLPGKVKIEWTAEIVKEEEDRFLGWSSIPNSTIDNAGKVEFKDANDGQGTEIDVTISYRPPLGIVGAGIAKLLNPVFENIVRNDIHNFKLFMETGQLPKKNKKK